MRRLCVGIAALLLSACGGEVYPVTPTEAFTSLSSMGTPRGLDPLPGALHPVSVSFESVPGNNSVQWLFRHDGDDLARIVAEITPDGDKASNVRVGYLVGTAPDEKWRNAQARRLIEYQIQRLVIEAVDSTLEGRAFSESLYMDVNKQVLTASAGALMDDVSASLDEHIAKEKASKNQASAGNTYAATKPSTNLNQYSGSN